MTIRHHMEEDVLLSYAAGDLDDASSLLVATHLALCPACRSIVRLAEDLGGVLIDDLNPVSMSADSLSQLMVQIETPAPEERPRPAVYCGQPILPQPLRNRIGGDLDQVRWRRIGPGVRQMLFPCIDGGATARMLWIDGGKGVLEHGHNGEEWTLVLSGGFHDGQRAFARGDIEYADPAVIHRPVADPGAPCICLAVTSASLKFFDFFGQLAQPFFRI